MPRRRPRRKNRIRPESKVVRMVGLSETFFSPCGHNCSTRSKREFNTIMYFDRSPLNVVVVSSFMRCVVFLSPSPSVRSVRNEWKYKKRFRYTIRRRRYARIHAYRAYTIIIHHKMYFMRLCVYARVRRLASAYTCNVVEVDIDAPRSLERDSKHPRPVVV